VAPKLGPYRALIDGWLIADKDAPSKHRHTVKRVWQRLVGECGADVAKWTVREYVAHRRRELGYLAPPDGAAELVSQVISERNERSSLIVTTNLPSGEWTKVFPYARLAKAVIDRITHKAHIIDTGTESWRFHDGLSRKGARKA
jgi:hypothetical protein